MDRARGSQPTGHRRARSSDHVGRWRTPAAAGRGRLGPSRAAPRPRWRPGPSRRRRRAGRLARAAGWGSASHIRPTRERRLRRALASCPPRCRIRMGTPTLIRPRPRTLWRTRAPNPAAPVVPAPSGLARRDRFGSGRRRPTPACAPQPPTRRPAGLCRPWAPRTPGRGRCSEVLPGRPRRIRADRSYPRRHRGRSRRARGARAVPAAVRLGKVDRLAAARGRRGRPGGDPATGEHVLALQEPMCPDAAGCPALAGEDLCRVSPSATLRRRAGPRSPRRGSPRRRRCPVPRPRGR